jgi:hypothetical protein
MRLLFGTTLAVTAVVLLVGCAKQAPPPPPPAPPSSLPSPGAKITPEQKMQSEDEAAAKRTY